MCNFYELLNVAPTATFEELKRNYKLLILQCHPDKLQQQAAAAELDGDDGKDDEDDVTVNVDDLTDAAAAAAVPTRLQSASTDPNAMMRIRKKFVAITEAWNTLKDPIKRKHYDAELLQTKFQTHSNVYATITLNDMRREQMCNDDGYDDDDDAQAEAEEEEQEMVDKEEAEQLVMVAQPDNIGENQAERNKEIADSNAAAAAAAAAVGPTNAAAAATSRSIIDCYVYDCRCGGQYVLDDSAFGERRSKCNNSDDCDDNNKDSNRLRRQHEHHQQRQRENQQQQAEKLHHKQQQQQQQQQRQTQQQEKRTSVKLSAYDCVASSEDNDKEDNNSSNVEKEEEKEALATAENDEVLVECSECSLRLLGNHTLLPSPSPSPRYRPAA